MGAEFLFSDGSDWSTSASQRVTRAPNPWSIQSSGLLGCRLNQTVALSSRNGWTSPSKVEGFCWDELTGEMKLKREFTEKLNGKRFGF